MLNALRMRPVKATRLEIEAGASVATAFSDLLQHCTAHMYANANGVQRARNPEYLHQFRVGLRRLRSVLRVFRPLLSPQPFAELTAEIGWLAAILGRARDWDVFIGESIKPLQRNAGNQTALAPLRRRCAGLRRIAAHAVQTALDSPRYADLQISLERLIATPCWSDDASATLHLALPLREFAAQRMARRENSAHRLADRLNNAAGDTGAMRHELRIAVKKLRYTIDFFGSLFDRAAAREYADALAELQDALGQLNDCATARRLLDATPAGRSAGTHALARRLVIDAIVWREQCAVIALDAASWKWRSLQPFWQ